MTTEERSRRIRALRSIAVLALGVLLGIGLAWMYPYGGSPPSLRTRIDLRLSRTVNFVFWRASELLADIHMPPFFLDACLYRHDES